MNESRENPAPVFVFFGVLWLLSNEPLVGDYGMPIAVLMMIIGALAIRFAGRALFRDGARAGFLLAQVALWFALFLWAFPATALHKIFVLWGIGIPLLLLGAGARLLHRKLPQYRDVITRISEYAAPALSLFGALYTWFTGGSFWRGLVATLIVQALGAIPLYYGWRLASPAVVSDRDARFGSEEAYREAGMSDER